VPLRGAPSRLILAGVPWVTSWFPSILLGYNMESLSELDYLVLFTKLSSCLCVHKSGRAGSTDRLTGLLVGRARLSGIAKTLVGEDPWVPMSHKPPIDVWQSGGDKVTPKRSGNVASMKPHRVHGNQKRKPSSVRTKANIKSLESRSRGLK
jgi:hypothetical protein